jgi:hypothetical protein
MNGTDGSTKELAGLLKKAHRSVSTVTIYRLDNINLILNVTQTSLLATTTRPTRGGHRPYPSYLPGDKMIRVSSSTLASSYDKEFAQTSGTFEASGTGGCVNW